jgi:hypothetical protein
MSNSTAHLQRRIAMTAETKSAYVVEIAFASSFNDCDDVVSVPQTVP